jgi:hypothetical protein
MKSKSDLKDVFNGLSSVLYQSTNVDMSSGTFALTPEYDLPVTVDTLKITQDDPTINHYKIVGIDGDWTSSSTVGDTTFQFTVPTKHTDVLKLAYGTSAVKEITSATINTGDADIDNESLGYEGVALELKKKKVTGTFVLVDEEKNNLFVMANVAVYAKILYENPSTEPVAVQFTGTIEGAGKYSLAWLKKKSS